MSLVGALQLTAQVSHAAERTVVGVVGSAGEGFAAQFEQIDGVESVVPTSRSYALVGRTGPRARSTVRVGKAAAFGGTALAVCAGPCSVESREQLETCAAAVARAGANVLRGGAFKPRTSPYAFQGLGEEGLRYLRDAADRFGLAVVTEVLIRATSSSSARYADMLQIGTRNMQNFALLREVGAAPKAGAPQARHRRDDRRVADGGRIRRRRRQSARGAVRARRPRLRSQDAQHSGPRRRAARPEPDAPSGRSSTHRMEPACDRSSRR